MGIEQHLMGLKQIGPDQESAAVGQLRVRDLQVDALATNGGPVLAPVELEGFARLEDQRHKGTASCCLLGHVPIRAPSSGKGGNTPVGPVVAKLH